MNRHVLTGAASAALLAGALSARAATYQYVDWSTADVQAGTASGQITVPGAVNPVDVTFAATFADGSSGNLFFAQTAGGTNYWNPTTPYISPQVENAPPDSDILALIGGVNQIYTVTLSEPIKDPIMALVSVGSRSIPITYEFDSPFTIVSQGVGYWGGGASALDQQPNNVLAGAEGHGTIQFIGTFSKFSWVVPNPETWHGFTFGIRTTLAQEPTPPPPTPTPTPIPLPAAVWPGLALLAGVAARLRRRGV